MALLNRRNTFHCVAFGLSALLFVHGTAGAGQSSGLARADEYRVKAAFLYNLPKFVDWPPDAFADTAAPFVLCILGPDPFGPVLDETLRGRLVGGRPVTARRIADVTPGCHVLFIADSEQSRLPVIIDRLRNQSVLTVGEESVFTDRGGMVGLTTEGERVRFSINTEMTEREHLKVSARLLALATSIKKTNTAR